MRYLRFMGKFLILAVLLSLVFFSNVEGNYKIADGEKDIPRVFSTDTVADGEKDIPRVFSIVADGEKDIPRVFSIEV